MSFVFNYSLNNNSNCMLKDCNLKLNQKIMKTLGIFKWKHLRLIKKTLSKCWLCLLRKLMKWRIKLKVRIKLLLFINRKITIKFNCLITLTNLIVSLVINKLNRKYKMLRTFKILIFIIWIKINRKWLMKL